MRTFLLTVSTFALACGAAEGDSCRLQSDCSGGLMCFEGLCTAPLVVSDALSYHDTGSGAVVPESDADTPSGTDVVAAPTHPCGDQPYSKALLTCETPRGIFAPSTSACLEPSAKYAVRSVVMEPEGGFVKMAPVATPVLANGFSEGTIKVELWRDGDFALNCDGESAWIRSDADRAADCTPKYGASTFPLLIPIGSGLNIEVNNAQFDLTTGRMTGLVDRDKLLADLPEVLRATAAGLVQANVDTDGDGTPEDSSVTLTVCFK